MASRAYAWLATNGGIWSLASNWSDLSDGISPSLTLPGPQDSVAVAGATGSVVQTMTGQGNVLAASFSGNTALAGSFTIATLTLGANGAGGLLDVGSLTTLADNAAAIESGSLFATASQARVIVGGALTLGQGQAGLGAAQANLYATGGGAITAATLTLNASSATLYIDPISSIEVGTLGGAVSGALTIDPGAVLTGQGDANAYGAVINAGTILASAGTLLVGSLTGQGALEIAAGAELALFGRTAAGQAVTFTGAAATLAWQTEYDAPAGTITGFTAGDAFDVLGSPISSVSYTATGSNLGVLTLTYGGQTADRLTLAGAYANDVFLTAGDGAGGTLIFVTPNVPTNGTLSPGTATQDRYLWTPTGGGAWNAAANWSDQTAAQTPAKIAPGTQDSVTINGPQSGGFAVIAGPANASTLAITGAIGLAGNFTLGTLSLGTTLAAATLDLLPNAMITAQTAAIADGGLTVSGGATVAVAGTLSLGGGISGVGLPVTALSATSGGAINAGAITLGGGSGDSLTTDPSASIEIGTANHPTAGAVTVDAGASLTGNGAVNPYGNVIDNGAITATGGTLLLGSVSGTGALAIGASAALALNASTGLNISITGTAATLAVADERIALTGTITGLANGDAIDVQNDPITAVSTSLIATTGVTTLTLYYGTSVVGSFSLAGTFTSDRFVLLPDAGFGTDIEISPGSGGGGTPGQGTTDTLAWATPGSGAWSHVVNWYDVTNGTAATGAPGAQNTVALIGPTGGAFQTITGPANCATLGVWGNSLLGGAYTAGVLNIGGALPGNSLTAGTLALAAGATLAAADVSLTNGAILVGGTAAALNVTGSVSLGSGAAGFGTATTLIALSNHAGAQWAGLSLGGGAGDVLTTDATASIEIGTLGGAAAGAITIDPGITVAGNGALNPLGAVIDNGTLTAQGGTLTLGKVTGTGTLAIGAEATLALTAADLCPITLTGGGATLLLPGTAALPAGPISGFAQGDFILTGTSQISSVSYTPGNGGIGTLTLLYGSQVAGLLLLAGNYAGASFTVSPAASGSAITVQTTATGPSAGTTTPDDYAWTGGTSGAWNTAANWQDSSAGQNPAAIAPGALDLVSIAGGTSGFTTITGPANAASLALTGEVALAGQYAIGALAIGGAGSTGVLALGAGAALQAASVSLTGGLELQAADLAATGTLAITGGVAVATQGALLQAAAIALSGTLATDSTGAIEVGGGNDATAGAVTIDPGAALTGAGIVNASGAIIDNGSLTALGGTLLLGSATGTGVLAVGPGATLDLLAAASAGLTLTFAGPGTLAAATTPAAAVAGFGAGDSILLPFAADTALYAATGAGTGILTLLSNGQTAGSLTLLGIGQDQSFTVTPGNGGTVLTTQTQPWSGGGQTMTSTGGTSQTGSLTGLTIWDSLSTAAQDALNALDNNDEAYLYASTLGGSTDTWAPNPDSLYFNIALVTDPTPDSKVVLPAAYEALIAQGDSPVLITDSAQGTTVLVGNDGADTIVAFAADDTLVGGSGGSVFFAQGGDDVIGGGNDTICANGAACDITTAADARSIVFLATSFSGYLNDDANQITSQGNDIIVDTGTPAFDSNSIVNATGNDTVFGPAAGQLVFNAGGGRSVLVGSTGNFFVNGGAGNGDVVWAGPGLTVFNGGAGSAIVVGGNGLLQVDGGAGALTVYGGIGQNEITGAAGPSTFVAGFGPSTVTAATGNHVWLAGAANNSLVAGNGNILLDGVGSSGDNVFDLTGATAGTTTVYGGAGTDTVMAGAANAIINAGSGGDVFMFTNGLTGGGDVIANFNAAADQLNLQGYNGYTSAVVNGSEVITLSDGTTIQLLGLTSLPTASIVTS